jgi:hypothetical protein
MISIAHSRPQVRLLALLLMTAVLGFDLVPASVQASPQLPDFTYQGRLTQNGAPANGTFDLAFALFDADQNGAQVGATITETAFPITDGLFTVDLAFPGAFSGSQMWLEVTVNGIPLLPRQPVATTPVAQLALKVAPNSITSVELATDSVQATEIADNSIDGGEIIDHSLTNLELAPGTIGTTELANSAVTTAKLANGDVTLAKIAGGGVSNGGSVTFTIPANKCADLTLGVGSAQAGDVPVFSWGPNAAVPANLIVTAMRATAGVVIARACNVGSISATVTSQPVNIRTFR